MPPIRDVLVAISVLSSLCTTDDRAGAAATPSPNRSVQATSLHQTSRDAQRVIAAWKALGLHRITVQSMHLRPGKAEVLPLGAAFDHSTIKASGSTESCTNVLLLAPRPASFELATTARDYLSKRPFPRDLPSKSKAGMLVLRFCGSFRSAAIPALAIRSENHTPVELEILMAQGKRLDDDLMENVLPERAGDFPSAHARSSFEPLPPAGGPDKILRDYVYRHGFPYPVPKLVEMMSTPGGLDGEAWTGDLVPPGCHVYAAAPVPGSPRGPKSRDIDIQVFAAGKDSSLVQDSSYAARSSVRLCVTRTQSLRILAHGVAPQSKVAIARASWPLPPGIPQFWPARAQQKLALALLENHSPWLDQPAYWIGSGGMGRTTVSVRLPPGRCYVVAAANDTLRSQNLTLRVHGAGFDAFDANIDRAVVAVCPKRALPVQLTVQALGSSPTQWYAAAWALRSDVPPSNQEHQ